MKRQKKPKVEILFEVGLAGERIKQDDFIEYLETVHNISKVYPEALTAVIDAPEIESLFCIPSFYVIYRKIAKRVTENDIRLALKELIKSENGE